MKIAIVGSRELTVSNLDRFLPSDVTEIVSGGARGVDTCAAEYAKSKGLRLTVFFPDYEKYGRHAPLERNKKIIDYADSVIVFWDGISTGTRFVINECKRTGKAIKIFRVIHPAD